MEPKMISTKHIKPEYNTQLKPLTVILGTANNFKGIQEPYSRPLMINAWSQTSNNDFSILNEIENREFQSQREKELEEKIRVLEENLKAHSELLSQIHATSARTSALLGQQQQQPQNQQYLSNNGLNSSGNNLTGSRTSQSSPKIVNAINTIQQVSSPAESVKYTIIAEGSGSHNDEPIEIQLAEDDGALNLNSSADSGRLEICLAPEENIEIKTEYSTTNSTIQSMQHQAPAIATDPDPSPSELHFLKKRKLATEQHESYITDSKYCNEQTSRSMTNVQEKLPSHKRRGSGNSLLKTPKMQNISKDSNLNMQTMPMQNITPTTTFNNSSLLSSGNDVCHAGIDKDIVMVSIGPNNTRIPAKLYETMNWTSASIATRKLLMAIFDRKVLATHSMTGKPSPAFKDHGKPIKQMLDPLAIADIIFAVTRKCNVSDKEVRNAITTKCADENKMMKLQMNKRTAMREMNKENLAGQF